MTKTLARLFTGSQNRQGLWIVPLLITIVLSIALIVQTDQFLNRENLFNLIAQAMPLIITAVGQLFVILVGGLDLSVGSLISFTTAILALDAPGYITIPAVFLLAALLGLTNGIVITRLNVHPIIATLAMQYIVLGAARILRPVSGGTIPDVVISSVSGSFLGIPMPIFWGICVALVAWKLLYGSRFGLHLFAIGGGISSGVEDATRNFGVADKRNVILAYVACSCFAALAGVFLAGRIVSGDPNVGLLFELDAITAVAIGGTQLSGGVGSLQGTIIGALVLALLSNGMNLVNVSPFIQTAIKGGILLLVVGFQTRKKMGL
ncbi:ABC transporter permease [Rhizobium rhizogenes]|uniref:Sugar ABC transporter permease protein n=1 Tax=Rhizobium rhizogenes NBRC 13257 TaxID=1220581 RepID=A0AA87U6V8_RHIRH|nr:ABC transporter permease [Rhizobium rhizogenes]NTG71256.1 ABC transporter permease [Rhizobium rhizogenes]NTH68597.1 ABC transporter permease [Rhizobium rhizogenes]TRB05209.1 ABC transporter permease [Rhizobium rhizogenes]TRB39467.1 ABC transporter permease [Rhizobium rhizogenes]TRB54743.1 ABC transporter permease [Rhizobium rhizogenes]